jgi:hypothetical protein
VPRAMRPPTSASGTWAASPTPRARASITG